MKRWIKLGLMMLGFGGIEVAAARDATEMASGPIVIAHRGASGYRPEHTLMSYRLGLQMNADYIEPDLVMTKDGHLVARHDIYLSGTTDIADHPEFADRKRQLEGLDDWFVFDFTLEELKTLKAIQPRPKRGQVFDGQESIPTMSEILALMKTAKAEGSKAGLYIEIKRPALFRKVGIDPTAALLAMLKEVTDAGIPVYFQCFDGAYLNEFVGKTDAELIWLIEGRKDKKTKSYVLEAPLALYGTKVDGVGLNKALLVGPDGTPTSVVDDAHAMGLDVHVWTVRNDQVPKGIKTVEEELKLLFSLGVDGVFADFPDTALQSRDSFMLLKAGPAND